MLQLLLGTLSSPTRKARESAAQQVQAAVQPLGLPFDWCLPHAHRSMSKVASQPSRGTTATAEPLSLSTSSEAKCCTGGGGGRAAPGASL